MASIPTNKSELVEYFHKFEAKGRKTVILYGDNGSGKTKLLTEYAKEYGFQFYQEKHTNGTDRYFNLLDFCKRHSKAVIDNVELYLHVAKQKGLLNELHAKNPNLKLIVSTHSPQIINNDWDLTISMRDLNKRLNEFHLLCLKQMYCKKN